MSIPPPPTGAPTVVIVGAGPSGLTTANLLAGYGTRVIVLESGSGLIDYPRGVGMDDETLRTFQALGLVDEVLAHTVPDQLLVFTDRKGRTLARLAPPMAGLGWPRRNGFVQPLVDRVLLNGLDRYPHAEVWWSTTVTSISPDSNGVTLDLQTADGPHQLRADWVIGADGGRSSVRKGLGIEFPGKTAVQKWLVLDVRNDPLGHPGAYVVVDPRRPYVSISIPHGIRRFEFMMLKGETDEDVERDDFIADLLAPLLPRTAGLDIIRRRVYAHQSRIAERFRVGRGIVVGDAAHLMPVWQGQGYNSGIRDAFNLSWKLAMVVNGLAAERLLDTYDLERRDHANAMIQLSTWVGAAVSIRNRFGAWARDIFFKGIALVPRLKTYIVQMRFKPMPTMRTGALTRVGATESEDAIGRLFPQPMTMTRDGRSVRLDDAIGGWFALIAWNNDPSALLDADARRIADALGIRLVAARPAAQLSHAPAEPADQSGVLSIGDGDGALKRWFEARAESVVLLRPDRIVAGAVPAYAASDMLRDFARVIGFSVASPSTAAVEPVLERMEAS